MGHMRNMAILPGQKLYHHIQGTQSSCLFRVNLCLSSRTFAQPSACITMLSIKWKKKNLQTQNYNGLPVLLLPAHPASFAHNFVSGMPSPGLISLLLDSLIWETASPRTHKPNIVNESLDYMSDLDPNSLTLIAFQKKYISKKVSR